MDKFLLINAVIAGSAILVGLYSRKFTAALAVWFWLAVVHTGLILLAMGQAGSLSVPELPMLGEVLKPLAATIDTGMHMAQGLVQTYAPMAQAYLPTDFANSALLAYFVATVGILLGLVFASFLVGSVLTGLVSLITPRKARA